MTRRTSLSAPLARSPPRPAARTTRGAHHDREADPGRRRPRRRIGRRGRDPAPARRALGRRLGRDGLAGLAADVGSDVPALLLGEPAYAEGRGERVSPVLRAVDDVGREAVRVRRLLGGRLRVVGRGGGDGPRRGSPDRRGGGRQQRPPRERPVTTTSRGPSPRTIRRSRETIEAFIEGRCRGCGDERLGSDGGRAVPVRDGAGHRSEPSPARSSWMRLRGSPMPARIDAEPSGVV